jgi:hypothetical protein
MLNNTMYHALVHSSPFVVNNLVPSTIVSCFAVGLLSCVLLGYIIPIILVGALGKVTLLPHKIKFFGPCHTLLQTTIILASY